LLVVVYLADFNGFPGEPLGYSGFLYDLSILSGGEREFVQEGVFIFLKLVSRVFLGEYLGLKLGLT